MFDDVIKNCSLYTQEVYKHHLPAAAVGEFINVAVEAIDADLVNLGTQLAPEQLHHKYSLLSAQKSILLQMGEFIQSYKNQPDPTEGESS